MGRMLVLCSMVLGLGACSVHDRMLDPDHSPDARLSPEHRSTPVSVDPVCGAQVKTTKSSHHVTYRGTEFYFDCDGCLHEFTDHPESYTVLVN